MSYDEIDRQLGLAQDLIKLARREKVAEIGSYVKQHYSPQLDADKPAMQDFNQIPSFISERNTKFSDGIGCLFLSTFRLLQERTRE